MNAFANNVWQCTCYFGGIPISNKNLNANPPDQYHYASQ